ncbi:ABC transporter substrate-binding protein [Streptomyces sp. NBC_01614]|uniref:ABC transporter substrate-binding protein n=1 Tax=Streptomyces sp. NBC_01614 TaxID=2975897 RepID=UPI0038693E4A
MGIVADVNVSVRPGLFQSAVDGLRAWASYTNDHGGLAGRKVVVDFYDSQLTADGWRNGVVQSCEHDLAMVGTTAIADDNVRDMKRCGIPDLAALAPSTSHSASPLTFTMIPTVPNQELLGAAKWYLKAFKSQHCCKGVWLNPSASPASLAQANDFVKGQLQLGFTEARVFPVTGQESNFTPFALAIKKAGATYVRVGTDYNQTVALRREAKVQGVNSVAVWDCSLQCYNPDFIKTGGTDVEGQYVYIFYEPFEETDKYPGLQKFVNAMKKYQPKTPINSFSQNAWISGLMFGQAVQKVVADKGANGLTRANLLRALRGIHDFTADGTTGAVDIGNHQPNPCFMVMQVRSGKFVRVYPDKGLNCSPANVVTVKP